MEDITMSKDDSAKKQKENVKDCNSFRDTCDTDFAIYKKEDKSPNKNKGNK